jgi:endo-1,4-beta-mannosidase
MIRTSSAGWRMIAALALAAQAPLNPAFAAAPPPGLAAPSQGRLPKVRMDGAWFARDGKRFIPVGAHWVPAKAAMAWPTQWDPKDIEADFAKMRDLGFNLVRFDLLWAWFEPRPGDYNPEAFKQLDFPVSLAHKYRIYLHPSMFIGGEVGEAYWDVPWRHGRNPHTDPDMLRFETDHAAELARRYRDETAILAWDLTDEPPFWIVAGETTDSMAVNWTRLITGALRREDPNHPIVAGTSGEEPGHGPFRADNIAKEVDFFSVHPFTIYMNDLFPDPMLSERSTYGAAWEITLSRGAGKPAMIHEMGGSTAQYAPERVAAYDRANLYSGLGAGSIGGTCGATPTPPPNSGASSPTPAPPRNASGA